MAVSGLVVAVDHFELVFSQFFSRFGLLPVGSISRAQSSFDVAPIESHDLFDENFISLKC